MCQLDTFVLLRIGVEYNDLSSDTILVKNYKTCQLLINKLNNTIHLIFIKQILRLLSTSVIRCAVDRVYQPGTNIYYQLFSQHCLCSKPLSVIVCINHISDK